MVTEDEKNAVQLFFFVFSVFFFNFGPHCYTCLIIKKNDEKKIHELKFTMNRLFVGYSWGGARKSRFMRGNTTTSLIRIKLTWTTPCYT